MEEKETFAGLSYVEDCKNDCNRSELVDKECTRNRDGMRPRVDHIAGPGLCGFMISEGQINISGRFKVQEYRDYKGQDALKCWNGLAL